MTDEGKGGNAVAIEIANADDMRAAGIDPELIKAAFSTGAAGPIAFNKLRLENPDVSADAAMLAARMFAAGFAASLVATFGHELAPVILEMAGEQLTAAMAATRAPAGPKH